MKINHQRSAAIFTLLTVIISLFMAPMTALAASMENVNHYPLQNTWKFHLLGMSLDTEYGIYQKQIDGNRIAFCIEHGIPLDMAGSGYQPQAYSSEKKELLTKIAYYGYRVNPTKHNYALTQMMIWEALGDELVKTNTDFYSFKAAVMQKVNDHDRKPSFNGQTIDLNVGDKLVLNDANGVLSKYGSLVEDSTGLQVQKNGNSLTLTATKDSKQDGNLKYAIAHGNDIGESFMYTKGAQQKLVDFKLSNGGEFNVHVRVHPLGRVRIHKIDEQTKQPLPGVSFDVTTPEHNKQTVKTDGNGDADLGEYKAGTPVTIEEVQAPHGYHNRHEKKTVTVESGKTITAEFGDKRQLGNVTLSKIGREYGTNMYNKYYSLNGAIYGVFSADGKKMGTMTTDAGGHAEFKNLPLGSYYAQEEKAPAGYELSKTHLNFTLNTDDQNVEVTSAAIKAVDDEQNGMVFLNKADSQDGSQGRGAATVNGAVYEIRRTSDDKLMDTKVVKNGGTIMAELPLDDYYWIETKAPVGYLKDTEKHHFQIKIPNQTEHSTMNVMNVKEHVITGGFDLIKFGNYDWHTALSNKLTGKSNEMKVLKGVEFKVTSNTTHKIVASGVTNDEGYLRFNDLPYDTYTVDETGTPEGYQGSKSFQVTVHEQNESHHYTVENKVLEEKLRVVKADVETGHTIPRADAAFKIKSLQTKRYVTMPKPNHDGYTDTFYTNHNGYLLTTEALPYGKYELEEVQAPEGYVLSKEKMPFTVDGKHVDKTIDIKFVDKSQKGIVMLDKTGQKPVGVEKHNTKFGPQYQFKYDKLPLAGAKFNFVAREDIKTHDGTLRAKKGSVVASATTDKNGHIKTPELYLGKYSAIEKIAPNGFIVNKDPLNFELKYAGQLVQVTSTSLEVNNEFQKINVNIHKQEEQVERWEHNAPALRTVAANGQVFGLFTKDAFNDKNMDVPANALLATATVKDGKAAFADMQLPEGSYYVKELDAGALFDNDNETYAFDFKASDNNDTKSFEINSKTGAPILNKLHFNQITFRKLNEAAKLIEKKGYQYSMDDNAKGATFDLLDDKQKVLRSITINEDSLGSIKQLPVGTFYLKETHTADSHHVLSTKLVKLVSTKNGVTVFDADGQKLNDQAGKDGSLPLFELKNYLAKGSVELTKSDVSTGELLPDTKVKLINDKHEVVFEGKTDAHGVVKFGDLPVGQYEFIEYDAPKGYEINPEPVKFEIKTDGEIVKAKMVDHKKPTPTKPAPKQPETPKTPEQPKVPAAPKPQQPQAPKPEQPKVTSPIVKALPKPVQKMIQSLPQTGEASSVVLAIIGMVVLVAGSSLYLYFAGKKKK